MTVLHSVALPFRKVAQWLRVPAHRKQTYKAARVVLPALVAIGWLTTGQQDDVLTVLNLLASFGVPHLAARNTES